MHSRNVHLYGISFIEAREPNIWQKIVSFFKRENPYYVVLDATKVRVQKESAPYNYPIPNWILEDLNKL